MEATNIVFTSLEVSWDTSGLTSIASLRSKKLDVPCFELSVADDIPV